MSERLARRFGTLGILLVVLTIPIYFIDLLLLAPNYPKLCSASPDERPTVVLLVFGIGVLAWIVGLAFSVIAITQRTSRVTGIGGVIIALVIPIAAPFGAFLLLAGECVPEAALGLGLLW